MELCGDLVERVHENINAQQGQLDVQDTSDDQVAEIASETKTQARSQSSMEGSEKQTTTISSKTNGSGSSITNASR